MAAYVAAVAGQRGKDAGALASAGAPKVSNKPIAAKNGVLEMDADPTGALAFASTKATAPAGALEFVMGNESSRAAQHRAGRATGRARWSGRAGSRPSRRREGREVHLPVHGPGPRRRWHEGRTDGQVGIRWGIAGVPTPSMPQAFDLASVSGGQCGQLPAIAGEAATSRPVRRSARSPFRPPPSRSGSRPPSPRAAGRARSSRPDAPAATMQRSRAAAPARRMSRTRGQHARQHRRLQRPGGPRRSRSPWPPARCPGARGRSPRSARRSGGRPRRGRRVNSSSRSGSSTTPTAPPSASSRAMLTAHAGKP